MNIDDFYTDHWKHIEDDRFSRYKKMFIWNERQLDLLSPAEICPGQTILDLGSGPGSLTYGLSRLVGPSGTVHGVDINERFVSLANEKYKGEKNIHFQQINDHLLPFDSGVFDRVICKNVLEYVPDLIDSLTEVKRVLRPDGMVHAIDSDWGLVVVQPWSKETVDEFFSAASPAFREPHIGRKLMGVFKNVGFDSVDVSIIPFVDQLGSGLNVLNNMASYITTFQTLPEEKIHVLLEEAEKAVESGFFLFCLPQFLVTGSVS